MVSVTVSVAGLLLVDFMSAEIEVRLIPVLRIINFRTTLLENAVFATAMFNLFVRHM